MAKMKFSKNKKENVPDGEPWLVLIADDEAIVHMVSKMILKDFHFEDKPLELVSVYSGVDTVKKLEENDKFAILLLDVIMETTTAGLDAVNIIREELENHEIRIILRTGQAGTAIVTDIINQYDINEYKNKTSFTEQQLKDAITLALRSYRDIQRAKK